MSTWISPDGSHHMHYGECFSIAPTYAGAVRLLVTSPPYNLGKGYEQDLPWDEYFTLIDRLAHLCDLVLEPGGYAFINFQVEYCSPVRLEEVYRVAFAGVGMRVITERVWKKRFDSVRRRAYNHRSPRACAEHENLWTLRRESDTGWDPPRDKERSYRSVWDTSAEPRGALKQHPAAFPEAIPGWAIDVHCDPGDLVMDCFGGVGTTSVAAVHRKCRSVCMEKERNYWLTAVENVTQALETARSETQWAL